MLTGSVVSTSDLKSVFFRRIMDVILIENKYNLTQASIYDREQKSNKKLPRRHHTRATDCSLVSSCGGF